LQPALPKRLLAEFVSTYCLVLIGCGSMAVESKTGLLTHVGVAIVWGLIVMVMIYTVGRISGAHMNPAVSIAFAAVGRMPAFDAAAYVITQCAGALTGAAAIAAVLGVDDVKLGSTMTELATPAALGVEFMMTALLMFVVMGVSTGAKEESITAGLAVGATIAMEAFVAGPLTKASMNPARSIGPALVSGYTEDLWIYMVAPVSGALCGGFLYLVMQNEEETDQAAT
jgi:MIP family channel proteins